MVIVFCVYMYMHAYSSIGVTLRHQPLEVRDYKYDISVSVQVKIDRYVLQKKIK